jgi:hypothetical protein
MSIYLMKEEVLAGMQPRWGEFYAQYTLLRPVGGEMVGPCPLHNGTGPNFKVHAETGRWYCHSQCGRGGDGLAFLEEREGLDFPAALERLAAWLGLAVPPHRPSPAPKRFVSSRSLSEANRGDRVSVRFALECHAVLMADKRMVAWLRVHRGLTEETLQRFEIGLTDFTWSDQQNDVKWKRVTFPVYDREGRLTNIRKHLFAFDEDLNRAKLGKTLPWDSGLPADLFPLCVLWGPNFSEPASEEPTPAASGDPSRSGKGGGKAVAEASLLFERPLFREANLLSPSRPPFPSREGSPLAAGVGLRTDHLLLVEGEADALLANQLGFPAVTGTLGAGGWRPQNTLDLAGLPRLTILYDSDEAGRKGAKARAQDLAGTIPDIRIAVLPPGLGKDLTEWIVEAGATAEDLARVIDEAERVEGPPARILGSNTERRRGPSSLTLAPQNWGGGASSPSSPTRKPIPERLIDLADVPAPPLELPFLWGAFLNEGVSHWMTGRTGLGKSTFAFNLACALAEGRTLWGIECRPRRVLYVDMESGDVGRALKVQRLYQDRPRPLGKLLFVREPMRLPDESAELVAYLDAARATDPFDLVIFDTARRVFSVKDENDNAEVYNRIIPTLDALKVRGIASLTMGHPPKNGGLGARGAGAQEDAGDINLQLTMHRGEVTDADGIIALSITKNRLLGLGQPPLYLKRIGHDLFERVDASSVPPAEDLPEKQGPRDRCRAAVLALLESNGGKAVAYKDVRNALEAQGMAQATINRALKELLDENEVVQPNLGQYVLYDPFA